MIPSYPACRQRAAASILCLLSPLFCVGQTAPTLPDPGAANSAAIEAVRAGSRNEASAAWWGFNAEDATECLQSAIDSGAKKVVVPFMGTEWIVRPIRLRGNLELVFEPGVLVLAKKGEFRGKGDSLFAASDAENITLAALTELAKNGQYPQEKLPAAIKTLEDGGFKFLITKAIKAAHERARELGK